MKQNFHAIAAVVALGALAGCGNQNTALPVSSSQPFEWGAGALAGATYVSPFITGGLNVTVLVRPQNPAGLIQYAQDVSNPSSPLYRQFLNPQQIAERFGASQEDYRTTAAYFAKYGLSVAGWPQRLGLVVTGPVSGMQRAFGTAFGVFAKDGKQFVAPSQTPRFAASIPVNAVQNLVTLNLRHRNIITSPSRVGENDGFGYSPQVLQAAFDYNGAYSAGYTGSGINVGIIGTGPIEAGDLPALAALYHVQHTAPLAVATVRPAGVAAGLGVAGIPTATPAPAGTPVPNPGQLPDSGSFSAPPPATGTCNGGLPKCNPEDAEAQLDTQQIATLAYNANVLFYLAYNTNDCSPNVSFPNLCPTTGSNAGSPQIGINEADAEIDQAIADNKADIISISYGIGEMQQFGVLPGQYEVLQFAALAAEGVAVFVSSGDFGAAGCLTQNSYEAMQCAEYPASDPNVTAVGGVTAPLNTYGQLTGPMIGWGTNTGLNQAVASGGGPSVLFAAQPWQKSALGVSKREVPDVALLADPQTGVAIFVESAFPNSTRPQSGPQSVGGTSAAAPQMAAMWALVLDACKKTPNCANGQSSHPYRLGNAAPYLYSIYKGTNLTPNAGFTPHLPYSQVFNDIVYGNNSMPNPGVGGYIPGFSAGPGYDEVTGLGVPYGGHLVDAVVDPAPPAP